MAAFLLEEGSNEIRCRRLGDFATVGGTLMAVSAARSHRRGDGAGDTVMVYCYWINFDGVVEVGVGVHGWG